MPAWGCEMDYVKGMLVKFDYPTLDGMKKRVGTISSVRRMPDSRWEVRLQQGGYILKTEAEMVIVTQANKGGS